MVPFSAPQVRQIVPFLRKVIQTKEIHENYPGEAPTTSEKKTSGKSFRVMPTFPHASFARTPFPDTAFPHTLSTQAL